MMKMMMMMKMSCAECNKSWKLLLPPGQAAGWGRWCLATGTWPHRSGECHWGPWCGQERSSSRSTLNERFFPARYLSTWERKLLWNQSIKSSDITHAFLVTLQFMGSACLFLFFNTRRFREWKSTMGFTMKSPSAFAQRRRDTRSFAASKPASLLSCCEMNVLVYIFFQNKPVSSHRDCWNYRKMYHVRVCCKRTSTF